MNGRHRHDRTNRIVNAVKTRTIAREGLDSTRGVAIGGGVAGASSPPLSHRNGWRSLGVPRSLIWPSTMHNKRALDGRLCRAVARLLVTMAWPPLGGSTRNTWQTRKQCARAALRRDFAHLGCAHANKLSPPLSLFSRFSIPPSLFASPSSSTFAKYAALFLRGRDYAATSVSTEGLMTAIPRCRYGVLSKWWNKVDLEDNFTFNNLRGGCAVWSRIDPERLKRDRDSLFM